MNIKFAFINAAKGNNFVIPYLYLLISCCFDIQPCYILLHTVPHNQNKPKKKKNNLILNFIISTFVKNLPYYFTLQHNLYVYKIAGVSFGLQSIVRLTYSNKIHILLLTLIFTRFA